MDSFVTGSDEEQAMVKALQAAFRNTKHLYCMIHCKDNVRMHLTKIGVLSDNCVRVLSLLFDHYGIVGSADELTLDKRIAELLKYVRQVNIDAVESLQCRVIPKISSNCALMWKEAWLGSFAWTNNNCESANHLLKMDLNWQPAHITDLVDHLHDLVRMQYNELRYAMSGQGDFQLAQTFAKHYVPEHSG